MKVEVIHSKRLSSSQFDATKGSNVHSVMVMNRVIVDFKVKAKRGEATHCPHNFTLIDNYLMTSCRNFYFIGESKFNDSSRCFYFLSKGDMEDFMVWVKMALPQRDPEA